jgi:hypothetical protein
LFGRLFGRWRGALLAVITVGLYTVFVGGEPAMFRAAILGSATLPCCCLAYASVSLCPDRFENRLALCKDV